MGLLCDASTDEVLYDEASPSATTPRLFSDSLVGETNFRLFGNGQIYLFVLQYGCSTAPYVDAFGGRGFPVGAWTTVTAVMGGWFSLFFSRLSRHIDMQW